MAIMLMLSACGENAVEDTKKPVADLGEKKEVEGQTYNFKLAHIAPPDHIWNETAEKFAEELDDTFRWSYEDGSVSWWSIRWRT